MTNELFKIKKTGTLIENIINTPLVEIFRKDRVVPTDSMAIPPASPERLPAPPGVPLLRGRLHLGPQGTRFRRPNQQYCPRTRPLSSPTCLRSGGGGGACVGIPTPNTAGEGGGGGGAAAEGWRFKKKERCNFVSAALRSATGIELQFKKLHDTHPAR